MVLRPRYILFNTDGIFGSLFGKAFPPAASHDPPLESAKNAEDNPSIDDPSEPRVTDFTHKKKLIK